MKGSSCIRVAVAMVSVGMIASSAFCTEEPVSKPVDTVAGDAVAKSGLSKKAGVLSVAPKSVLVQKNYVRVTIEILNSGTNALMLGATRTMKTPTLDGDGGTPLSFDSKSGLPVVGTVSNRVDGALEWNSSEHITVESKESSDFTLGFSCFSPLAGTVFDVSFPIAIYDESTGKTTIHSVAFVGLKASNSLVVEERQ